MERSLVDKVLRELEQILSEGIFQPIENEFVELKDLTTGNEWKSLKESICAFLNTNGGIIIAGIRERDNSYNFPGYKNNSKTENNITELRTQTFKDDKGKLMDLTDYISFSIHDLLDKKVLVIYVNRVPDDVKYIFYNENAYIRVLSGDRKVPKNRLEAHQEYKENELVYRKEITPIIEAQLDDLDISKLNDYIQLLNRDIKVQNLLPDDDVDRAIPFLSKQHFINPLQEITTLGLIVCGKDPFHFLEFRVEVDCYVESPDESTLAQNKKVFKGTVLYLMEESLRFLLNSIPRSLSIEGGGTSQPIYPERILRESVNNALAHRNYQINKNIDITIKPHQQIEIKNPGTFKSKLLLEFLEDTIPIRRIIPSNAGSKNPKLANILKVFDKWEGKGWGMSTLVNSCLDNKIDLPYYKLGSEDITLVIPKGKLLDEEMELRLTSYEKYLTKKLKNRPTTEQKLVLSYLYKSEMANKMYQYSILLTPDNNHLEALLSLKESGLITEHPKSTNIHPLFILDRNLIKRDFSIELEKTFQEDFTVLNEYSKKSLNIIYRHTKFNEAPVSARDVANEIYLEENKEIIDQKKYSNFVRKISNICSKLAKDKNMLTYPEQKGKKGYLINESYSLQMNLFRS